MCSTPSCAHDVRPRKKSGEEEDREAYKQNKKQNKKEVAKAKQSS